MESQPRFSDILLVAFFYFVLQTACAPPPVDDVSLILDGVEQRISSSSFGMQGNDGEVRLEITAFDEGDIFIIDDERTYIAFLVFDSALLLDLETEIPHEIDGTNEFDFTSDDRTGRTLENILTHTPGPNQVEALASVWLEVQCFCGHIVDLHTHTVEGSVTFETISEERLAGELLLNVEGQIPIPFDSSRRVELWARFDATNQ